MTSTTTTTIGVAYHFVANVTTCIVLTKKQNSKGFWKSLLVSQDTCVVMIFCVFGTWQFLFFAFLKRILNSLQGFLRRLWEMGFDSLIKNFPFCLPKSHFSKHCRIWAFKFTANCVKIWHKKASNWSLAFNVNNGQLMIL